MEAIELGGEIWRLLALRAPDAILIIDNWQNILFVNPATEKMFGWQAGELLGKPLTLLLPERFRSAHFRQVDHYGKTGASQRDNTQPMEFCGLRKSGEEFPAEVAIARSEAGGVLYYAAIIRDITEKKEKLLQLMQNQTRLALALEAGELGYWDIDLRKKQVFICENSAKFLQCQAGFYIEGDCQLTAAIHPEDKTQVTQSLQAILSGAENDFFSEFRVYHAENKQYRWVQAKGKITEHSAQGLPVRFTGVIRNIQEKKEKEQLQGLLQESALEAFMNGEKQERRRLAQELHDGLSQQIQLALFSLEKLRRKCAPVDENAVEEFTKLSRQLSEIAAEARSLAHNLAGFSIDAASLKSAIEQLFEKLSAQDKIRFHLDWRLEGATLTKEYAHNIYRIVQEIINNALRHSGAQDCWIAAQATYNQVLLCFTDNGRGFDAQSPQFQQGIGLSNLQNRVQYLKGSINLNAAPGKGCNILISIPLPE